MDNNVMIGGAQLRDMIVAGAALLEKNKATIDALNVFPVPDGDTGTNMSMTMQSAVREIRALPEDATATQVADAMSMGALKGARGNSGVILSQLFRGFSRAFKGEAFVNAELLSRALTMGSEAAYKAVMKPKEGTILTVSRVIAEQVSLRWQQGANVYRLMDEILESGERALAETPKQLPVLKEAGVVDSGGKGLLTIYRGFKLSLDGEEVESYEEAIPVQAAEISETDSFSGENIVYGYCTEFFIIHLTPETNEAEIESFRKHLERLGDSVVVASDADMIKVHVHSNAPGKVLQMALRFGELSGLKIENMREQNRTLMEERKKNETEFGLLAVSTGDGVDELFHALAVDALISGGQTMNPSIDSIASAINKINARNVFVLPNNSNIILAAQQAGELTKKGVVLIPTKTIPQGVAACMAYSKDATVEENEAAMKAAIKEVVSGAVTYAVRDTTIEGTKIKKGDMIGLLNNHMAATGKTVEEATKALIRKMIEKKGDDACTVTLYYGEDQTEENAGAIAEAMEQEYKDAEFVALKGGQPLYYYYIAVQ
ncbi:MAG TPA: DAK2 domain-containing protein [Eubacteriales bacterium]|nr:DAK2 domain-containing protein [Eubacteriales bacterium]